MELTAEISQKQQRLDVAGDPWLNHSFEHSANYPGELKPKSPIDGPDSTTTTVAVSFVIFAVLSSLEPAQFAAPPIFLEMHTSFHSGYFSSRGRTQFGFISHGRNIAQIF